MAGFVLLCLFLGLALLLVGACNTQGFPPAPPPGGGPSGGGGPVQQGSGATGHGGLGGNFGPGGPYDDGGLGGGGAGGQDGNGCLTHSSSNCVASCAISFPPSSLGSCDQNGSLTCPAGYLQLASCAPSACARVPTYSCCDQTTGAITQPPCGMDGLIADCPVGTLPEKLYICIPPSLGVTSCTSLAGQPCELPNMHCQSESDGLCACVPEDAGLIWRCPRFGDPVP